MVQILQPKDIDVLYLHANNQVFARGIYTAEQLREGIFLYLAFCERVLIPIDFLLDNNAFTPLFNSNGKSSSSSDIAKLIQHGFVVPVAYSQNFNNVNEYVKTTLSRNIVLSGSENQWKNRGAILNECELYAPKREVTPASYKAGLLDVLKSSTLGEQHFGTKYSPIISHKLTEAIKGKPNIYRSDLYKWAKKVKSPSISRGIKEIADAVYYAELSFAFSTSPAIPNYALEAVIYRLFEPTLESNIVYGPGTERSLSAELPDFSAFPLYEMILDMQSHPTRLAWLRARKARLRKGISSLTDDRQLWEKLLEWSGDLIEYLNARSAAERKGLVRKNRTYCIRNRYLKYGSSALAGFGIFSSISQLASQGFPVAGLMMFALSAGSKTLLKEANKRNENSARKVVSTVPVTPTFTLKGERGF